MTYHDLYVVLPSTSESLGTLTVMSNSTVAMLYYHSLVRATWLLAHLYSLHNLKVAPRPLWDSSNLMIPPLQVGWDSLPALLLPSFSHAAVFFWWRRMLYPTESSKGILVRRGFCIDESSVKQPHEAVYSSSPWACSNTLIQCWVPTPFLCKLAWIPCLNYCNLGLTGWWSSGTV